MQGRTPKAETKAFVQGYLAHNMDVQGYLANNMDIQGYLAHSEALVRCKVATRQPLHRNVQRFRGGLVFKAHRLCATLGVRIMKKKKKRALSKLGEALV